MEFSTQIRAGLGLINWDRKELAERSGLSLNGLSKIINGQSTTARSQKKIIRAFENAGLFFTRNGVEMDDSPVALLKDDDPETCYLLLLDDVARVLNNVRKPELLIANADDRASSKTVNARYRELRSANVAMRQLVETGNTYLMGPVDEYRTIPSKNFVNRVTLIYGDNVATVTAGGNTITILRDPVNAERERGTFNLLWSLLDIPTESTADEKF